MKKRREMKIQRSWWKRGWARRKIQARQGRERKVGIGKRRPFPSPGERLHIGGDRKIKQQRATPALLNIAFTACVCRRRCQASLHRVWKPEFVVKSAAPVLLGTKQCTCVRIPERQRIRACVYRRIYCKRMHTGALWGNVTIASHTRNRRKLLCLLRKKPPWGIEDTNHPSGNTARRLYRGAGCGRSYCCHTYCPDATPRNTTSRRNR